jgi:hypothetical protein
MLFLCFLFYIFFVVGGLHQNCSDKLKLPRPRTRKPSSRYTRALYKKHSRLVVAQKEFHAKKLIYMSYQSTWIKYFGNPQQKSQIPWSRWTELLSCLRLAFFYCGLCLLLRVRVFRGVNVLTRINASAQRILKHKEQSVWTLYLTGTTPRSHYPSTRATRKVHNPLNFFWVWIKSYLRWPLYLGIPRQILSGLWTFLVARVLG